MSGSRWVRLVDRCEVCTRPLDERPVAERRRCGEHLDQLALLDEKEITRADRPQARRRAARAARELMGGAW